MPLSKEQIEELIETGRITGLEKIQVSRRTRLLGWGWGYQTDPYEAKPEDFPTAPVIEGTLRQIHEAIRKNANYQSQKDVFTVVRWFYAGRPIIDTFHGYQSVSWGFVELAQGWCEHLTVWVEKGES